MKPGDLYRARSIIGSEFLCSVARESVIAGKPAIAPVISGRAWITGTHQHMVDPDDPWPLGYRLADTWPRL
jgi:proline racemase